MVELLVAKWVGGVLLVFRHEQESVKVVSQLESGGHYSVRRWVLLVSDGTSKLLPHRWLRSRFFFLLFTMASFP